jgi:serine/threonine protein kinase
MSDLVGCRLGPYKLLEITRNRRTSATYRAVGPEGAVALTVLPRSDDPPTVARLIEEARAVAGLRHPHIVPIKDIGEQQGYVYLVEDLRGSTRTLADILGDVPVDPMDPTEAIGLIAPLLMALGHAHERGVLHGDITPRRVALPSPVWPMLTDFAIGWDVQLGPATARRRLVLGTPAYLTPEQAFGLRPDHRTDVYAIAVVLYQMVVGRVPFEGDTPAAVIRQHAYDPPPPLRRLRPELPAALERAVLRALSKAPDRRHSSAREFVADLWAAVDSEGSVPVRVPAAPTGWPSDPLATEYAAGVRAFTDGQWDIAVEAFGRVARTDPTYEDVEALLRAARSALELVEER